MAFKIVALTALVAMALAAGNVRAQPYLTAGPAQVKAGDSHSGAYLAAGWRFGSFGVELAHINAGRLTATGIAATGTVSLGGGFSVLGKLGGYSVERETVLSTGSTPGTGAAIRTSTDYGTRPAVGVGVAYSVTEKFSLRALAERIEGKDDLDGVRVFTLGAVLSF